MLKSQVLRHIIIAVSGLMLIVTVSTTAQAQGACGTWRAGASDSRLRVTVVNSGTGNDCLGSFQIANGTGLGIGPVSIGGYTLDMNASAQNANLYWLWSFLAAGSDQAPLMPGLDLEIQATPKDPSTKAAVFVQGEMSLRAWSADLAMFLLKTILTVIDPTATAACAISDSALAKAIAFSSVRLGDIFVTSTGLAARGDWGGARQEFSQIIGEFFKRAASTFAEQGLTCLSSRVFERIAQQPLKYAKIGIAYLTWVPKAMFDYFKYQGRPSTATLEYIPPVIITPTPIPPPPPTATPPPPPPACVPPPELFDPPDGRTFYARNTILRWRPYDLKSGEVFDVLIWPEGGAPSSRATTTDTILPIEDLHAWQPGKYFWTVRVKRSDGTYASCEGQPFWFRLDPAPEPPPTKVPPRSTPAPTWSH